MCVHDVSPYSSCHVYYETLGHAVLTLEALDEVQAHLWRLRRPLTSIQVILVVLIDALALKSNELTDVQVQSIDTFSAARAMEFIVGYACKGGRGSGGRGRDLNVASATIIIVSMGDFFRVNLAVFAHMPRTVVLARRACWVCSTAAAALLG
jgi:hypothetical protein